jgi:hypothetical protein
VPEVTGACRQRAAIRAAVEFYRDPSERAAWAAAHFPEAVAGSLLDVGCGGRHLGEHAHGLYAGLDRPHETCAELARVARRWVLISLPEHPPTERPYYPPRRHALGPLMATLNRRGARLWPDLLALAYWALLERPASSTSGPSRVDSRRSVPR